MRSLIVITAGLSTPSSTRQVANQIADSVNAAISARGESLTVTVVELRELIPDLAQVMSTGISTPALDEVKVQLSAADGLIAISPVFKASYTGLFKMFFDTLDTDSLQSMPTIIAATAGSARHSLVLDYALRPLLTYLRAVVVPTGVFVATEDFAAKDGIDSRISRAAGELADLMVTESGHVSGLGGVTANTPTGRRPGVSPEEGFVPFSALLRGHDGAAGASSPTV